MTAQLCGFSLAVGDNEACYVPVGHRDGDAQGGSDLFAPEAKLLPNQIPEKDALEELQSMLEDPSVLKVGQDLKFDWQIFARRGIDMFPYDDTMLMSYVLDAGRGGHGMDDLAENVARPPDDPATSRSPAPARRRSRSTACRSRRPPNTPPRTPT